MTRPFLAAFVLLALAACSAHKPAPADEAAAPTPARKTVLDDQLKALQKAKVVQQTVDDAAKAQQKAVDDQGG